MIIDTDKLTKDEKILLAQQLWDSVISVEENTPIDDTTKRILDESLLDLKKNPGNEKSWNEVKQFINKKLNG